LKKQGEKKISKKPYVKADLSPQLNMALEIISEKLGNTKSGIVNSALEYYFKNQFPESLPKSEAEVMMKVKEKLRLEQFLNEIHLDDFTVRSLIGYQEELKEEQESLEVINKKINTISLQIKHEEYKNNNEKIKLLELKKELEEKQALIADQIKFTKSYMDNSKRRKSYISKENLFKIINN